MEHSYSKDAHPKGNVEVMATRSILIPRPPQCPSCHQSSSNDDILAKLDSYQSDPYFDQLPLPINDSIAKLAMEEAERLTRNVQNNNPDDEDWDTRVNKIGWTKQQCNLYYQVSSILDYDQLAKLAVTGRPNEGTIRRCSIDKSVARMRLALASVQWNTLLTQWLHAVLCEYLSANYMASYLDILQTLRTKCPTLLDKMIAQSTPAFNQDYLHVIMKRPYGANVPSKVRKLPGQSPIFVIVPSTLNGIAQQPSSRMKRWYSLFSTMASIAPIQHTMRPNQTIESITEQLVAVTRSKIQDLRNEMPNRHIILVGINAGASIAMQVALVETISSIVCMGFAFNTAGGARGAPDDRLLEIVTPVLFVLGRNSARSSQEEIESLRERMSAQTSLVVIGSTDDALRIDKFNRHLEGVTQSMVDNMIADEIQDFVSTCIINPPGPRKVANYLMKRAGGGQGSKKHGERKRKHKDPKPDKGPPRKVGRPRLNRSNEIPTGQLKPEKPKPAQAMLKHSNDSLKLLTQSPVASTDVPAFIGELVTSTPIASSDIVGNVENKTDSSIKSVNVSSEDIRMSGTPVVAPSPVPKPVINSLPTTPKPMQTSSPFVRLNPPKSGHVQSPGVKNFFIRKGIEKQASNQLAQLAQSPAQQVQPLQTLQAIQPIQSPTIITSPAIQPKVARHSIPPNKKIIIKSQQILVPATTVSPDVTHLTPINTSASTSSLVIGNANNTTANTSADLSGILDLPILFADNDGSIIESSSSKAINVPSIANKKIISPNTSASAASTILPMVSTTPITSTSATNILFSSADQPNLQNRSVVIGQAKSTKSPLPTTIVTSSSNKVILINRNQMKPQIVTSSTGTPTTAVLKTMPTIKLLQTGIPQGQAQLATNMTKVTPTTKIGFPSFKFVKNMTSSPAIVRKSNQILINKSGVISTAGGRNAFIIKSPMTSTVSTVQQAHPIIKGNVIPNRNITVRKVMNVLPAGAKQIVTPTMIVSTAVSSSTMNITTVQSTLHPTVLAPPQPVIQSPTK